MKCSVPLCSALREDPNIILLGEMRDLETIRLVLKVAETGHIAFGTLNTFSAAKTFIGSLMRSRRQKSPWFVRCYRNQFKR
jgi:Tfp pilus assembly pilus retraction ATPase PilT